MLTATRTAGKTKATTKTPKILFDATKHRNRHTAAFGAGLVAPTRWTGEYRKVEHTAIDEVFATELFGDAERLAMVEAYEEAIEYAAWEAAAVERYCSGHIGM